eukprot:TRINITY_DN4146_c0_g1_i3.p2 TRINITY_DN4146_c0_g1~~TRINITY_DN4146_c0_g1_i3.p2  ORF type:complete len:163 (+),score=60.20 TRINITY_DN4146_c0_g1_i3:112-600(+)
MNPAGKNFWAGFDGPPPALVADVVCTADGKSLCDSSGVRGYPTIKYGDPSNMEDYNGGRDFDALKKFAEENLKPVCGPSTIDLCDADQKAAIEKLQAMSADDLDAAIAEKEKEQEDAEETFKNEVSKLQATYEKLQSDKEATLAAIKASGLGTMKAVKAARK